MQGKQHFDVALLPEEPCRQNGIPVVPAVTVYDKGTEAKLTDFFREWDECFRKKKKIMIYIAGPFFNAGEVNIIQKAEKILSARGLDYFSPRLHDAPEYEPQTPEWSSAIFKIDRDAIDSCDIVLMIYHGNYSDTGTAWECGYAYATGKPVIVVQTGDSSNLMVHESAAANIIMEELESYDFVKLEEKKYKGKMF